MAHTWEVRFIGENAQAGGSLGEMGPHPLAIQGGDSGGLGEVIPILLRPSCLPRKGASSVIAARRSWWVLFLSEFRSTKLNYCSTTRRGRDIQSHPVFLYTCLRAFSRSKTEGVFFPPSDALHIGCPQFSSIKTMFVK